jgi:hypothetical protein
MIGVSLLVLFLCCAYSCDPCKPAMHGIPIKFMSGLCAARSELGDETLLPRAEGEAPTTRSAERLAVEPDSEQSVGLEMAEEAQEGSGDAGTIGYCTRGLCGGQAHWIVFLGNFGNICLLF